MNDLRIEHSLALQTDCHRWARRLVVMTFFKARTIESLRLEHVEGVSVVSATEPVVSFSTSGDKTSSESSALETREDGFCDAGIRAFALIVTISSVMSRVIDLHCSEESILFFGF